MFHLRKVRFMRACAKLASSQGRQKRFVFNISRSQARSSPKVFPQLFGQPTCTTHPHLLKPGEVIPGITLTELKERRRKLACRIAECENRSTSHLIIVPSSSKVYMTDKIPYVFRQNTEFLYFTGCQEPDSVLTILIRPDQEPVSTLFVQPKHEHAELWDGPRTGPEKAIELFGMDLSFSISKFEEYVSSFIKQNKNSLVWYDKDNVVQQKTHKKLSSLLQDVATKCPKLPMHKLRLIKSPAEVELAKKSCEIASAAIAKTIEMSNVGVSEHQLFATVDYECRMNGAEFLAYPPVVAAGNNANVIHYIVNNQIVKDGEMVLMDAGCEYHGYTSDITRTWPINGTFTDEQRVLYEIVLDVQKQLIQKLEEGPTLDVMFHEMCRLLGKRLKEIHLLPKHFISEKQLSSGAFLYCPHHVSHYLGMDVHDTNQITRGTPVEEGMIVTVEPGIYVNPKSAYAPPEFYGLGIRIEDDVLIDKNGRCTVLTQSCPKEIEDIERLAKMNQCSV